MFQGKNYDQELWLEYGFVMDDGFFDVSWNNEGNANELLFFILKLVECSKYQNRYFKIRVGYKSICIKTPLETNQDLETLIKGFDTENDVKLTPGS